VQAFDTSVYPKLSHTGWGLSFVPENPCAMTGLTIFHRFDDPKSMKKAFKKVKSVENSKRCDENSVTKITSQWMKNSVHHFIADEFRMMCNNYANPLLYSLTN